MGRREQSKALHQSAILDAAEVLVGECPNHITVEAIADRAGLAKGTIYNYFPGKNELLQSVANRARRSVEADINANLVNIDHALVRIATGMSVFMNLAIENPKRAAVLISLINDAQNPNSSINMALRTEVERGISRREINVAPAQLGVLIILIHVRTAMSLSLSNKTSDIELAIALLHHCIGSLAVQKNRARSIQYVIERDSKGTLQIVLRDHSKNY